MKLHFLPALLLMALTYTATAQNYQIPNAGFEDWDDASSTAEPAHWNSFATSDGTFSGFASTPHHYHRQGGRPGTSGQSYLTIYSTSIIGIVANGDMTTGRIHAGGLSASSSDNYNYTQRSQSDFSLPFTATPDSLYVWVSFYAADASSRASITATLHGDNDYRDPNDQSSPNLYSSVAKAQFPRTTTSASQAQWQLVKVPFVHSGNANPAYMLVSMTTNATPGGGSANDSLSVDDIQLVYSSWLTDIAINGTTIPGFDQGRLQYSLTGSWTAESLRAALTYETESSDATVAVTTEGDTLVLTVTAEDGVTAHAYRLSFENTGEGPVGIRHAGGLQFALYPNPAHESFNVLLPATATPYSYTLTLSNMQGKDLFSQPLGGGSHCISTANLPAGLYLVTLTSPEGSSTQKLLVR
jgi:hypothetical protein